MGGGRCPPIKKSGGAFAPPCPPPPSYAYANFKNAIEKLNLHFVSESRKSHKIALEKAIAFSAVKENTSVSIDQRLNSNELKLLLLIA